MTGTNGRTLRLQRTYAQVQVLYQFNSPFVPNVQWFITLRSPQLAMDPYFADRRNPLDHLPHFAH